MKNSRRNRGRTPTVKTGKAPVSKFAAKRMAPAPSQPEQSQ